MAEIDLDRVEEQQILQAGITGPGDANRLILITGTAVFAFVVTNGGDDWHRKELTVSSETATGWPLLRRDQWRDAAATGGLAAISTKHGGEGFAIDAVASFAPTVPENEYGIRARLAVRAAGGVVARLYRMNFQLSILARV